MKVYRTPKKTDGVVITLDSKDSGIVVIAPNGDTIEIVISDEPEHDGFPYDIYVSSAPIDGSKRIYPKKD